MNLNTISYDNKIKSVILIKLRTLFKPPNIITL